MALIHAQGVVANLAQRAVGPVLEVTLEQVPVAQDGARAAGLALAAVDVGVQSLGEGEFLLRLRQRLGLGGLVRVDARPELVDDLLGLRPDGLDGQEALGIAQANAAGAELHAAALGVALLGVQVALDSERLGVRIHDNHQPRDEGVPDGVR